MKASRVQKRCGDKKRSDALSAHSPAPAMQIFLRSLTGKVIPLTVDASDTVASLKAAIEKREGVPAPVQKLVLSGKELQDNLTLDAAGVKNEAIVSLILKKKEETADPMLQRLIDSFMAGARNKDVDVVFCFDTTGSMYGHVRASAA